MTVNELKDLYMNYLISSIQLTTCIGLSKVLSFYDSIIPKPHTKENALKYSIKQINELSTNQFKNVV